MSTVHWVKLLVCHMCEKAIIFYYIHALFILLCEHLPCLHMALFSPFLLSWSCLTRTTRRASPCSQFSTFLRDLLARRNLYTTASRESGLAAKWSWLHYDEAQGGAFCFCAIPMCLWLHFKYFTWFDIATMHAWIQLAVALTHLLTYYYGNTVIRLKRFN